jgi:hypothetical protein
MHSFHHSRGRILFEILCVLAVSALLAAASIQTGASALLLAAAVAGLFGLVHLFDLRQPKTVAAVGPQRIEVEPEILDSVPANPDDEEKPTAVDQPVAAEIGEENADLVEAAAPRASGSRRKGGSRKGSGRRASPRKTADVIEFAQAEEIPLAEVVLPVQTDEAADFAEPAHVPHAPLFEAEPYVRMPRPAFGRKAG